MESFKGGQSECGDIFVYARNRGHHPHPRWPGKNTTQSIPNRSPFSGFSVLAGTKGRQDLPPEGGLITQTS